MHFLTIARQRQFKSGKNKKHQSEDDAELLLLYMRDNETQQMWRILFVEIRRDLQNNTKLQWKWTRNFIMKSPTLLLVWLALDSRVIGRDADWTYLRWSLMCVGRNFIRMKGPLKSKEIPISIQSTVFHLFAMQSTMSSRGWRSFFSLDRTVSHSINAALISKSRDQNPYTYTKSSWHET